MAPDSVATAKLGELACTPDGRVFRYGKDSGSAITQFHLVSAAANVGVDTVSSSNDSNGNRTRVTEGSAGWTAGAYAGGWMVVDDGTGEGQIAYIEDNTADTLRLGTDWALSTALAVADSDITIHLPYSFRSTPITALLGQIRGVAQAAFTASYYGWVLVSGVGGVLPGETLTVDEYITPGDDTAGEVHNVDANETIDDISIVGKSIVANSTADKATLAFVSIL